MKPHPDLYFGQWSCFGTDIPWHFRRGLAVEFDDQVSQRGQVLIGDLTHGQYAISMSVQAEQVTCGDNPIQLRTIMQDRELGQLGRRILSKKDQDARCAKFRY